MGFVAVLFRHSYPLRLAWGMLVFLVLLPFTLLFSALNWMDGMLATWTVFCAAMGMTMRVHGERPPLDEPALWLANHL
jgi:1-acyl-sn-glycerol-3-phosphate acyltransferase